MNRDLHKIGDIIILNALDIICPLKDIIVNSTVQPWRYVHDDNVPAIVIVPTMALNAQRVTRYVVLLMHNNAIVCCVMRNTRFALRAYGL